MGGAPLSTEVPEEAEEAEAGPAGRRGAKVRCQTRWQRRQLRQLRWQLRSPPLPPPLVVSPQRRAAVTRE